MPLSITFQLYRGGQFYWWRKTGIPWENHQPVTSHWQTLSYNVVSSILRLSRIRTHSVSGDKHWLHLQFFKYSQTCIKRLPLEHRKSCCLREDIGDFIQGSIHMKFSMMGPIKMWPFNTADFLIQGWLWLENKMKIAETIYTHFQKVLCYLFWSCPTTLRMCLSEENSWNQLNKWKT